MYKTVNKYAYVWQLGVAVRGFVRCMHRKRNYSRTSDLYDLYHSQAVSYARQFDIIVSTILTMSAHYGLYIPCEDICDLQDVAYRMLDLAFNY